MIWKVDGIERCGRTRYERCVRKGIGGDFLDFRLGCLGS